MTKNLSIKSKSWLNSLGFYLLWFLLAALAVVVAFELQVTFVYLGILVVQSPSLRPTGWNTSTVAGINRCGYLLMAILWLGVVFYLEKYLSTALEEGRLWSQALRAGLMLVGVYLFCAALFYVLG